VFTADLHRRGAKAVPGEHAGDAGTLVEQHHRKVPSPRLSNARHGRSETEPGYGVEGGGGGGQEVDWHDVLVALDLGF
jgi:hypothetical protein